MLKMFLLSASIIIIIIIIKTLFQEGNTISTKLISLAKMDYFKDKYCCSYYVRFNIFYNKLRLTAIIC